MYLYVPNKIQSFKFLKSIYYYTQSVYYLDMDKCMHKLPPVKGINIE